MRKYVFILLFLTIAPAVGRAKAGSKNQSLPPNAVKAISVYRSSGNPIITFESSKSLGENINGPSVIRVPSWVNAPLGKYYMYFAHHHGKYIRLAYTDSLEGPWRIHEQGTLKLSEAKSFRGHIASPDVHVDNTNRRLLMFFHGPARKRGRQWTGIALSKDGLRWQASEQILGRFYFRVFERNGFLYAIDGGGLGQLQRAKNPMQEFEKGKQLFSPHTVRHTAVMKKNDTLLVFHSRYGDTPERILVSTVRLTANWSEWTPSDPIEVIRPETDYEGIQYPVKPSEPGSAVKVCQLRDPCIFEENGKIYLFYTIAGEMGIAMAELKITMHESVEQGAPANTGAELKR
jgi:hypothetical protein